MNFVKIPDKDFEMQTTPVTQAEWMKYMGYNRSHFVGDKNPVEMVSFEDAQKFVSQLNWSLNEKFIYRLPTEEEWEYCARAGSTTDYCFGDDVSQLQDYAWFTENSENKTHPVGLKKPNAWGLYDMHGNVWEWCDSFYEESKTLRVLCGCSWNNDAHYLRSAWRGGARPGVRSCSVGFRLVRESRIPFHPRCKSSSEGLIETNDDAKKLIRQIRAKLSRLEEMLK